MCDLVAMVVQALKEPEAVGVGMALVVPIMQSTSSCSQPMQAKPGSQWQTYLLAPPSSQVPCSSLEAAACGHNVRAGGGTGDERGGAQTRSSS